MEEALARAETVEKVIVLRRTDGDVTWHPDLWWHDVAEHSSAQCPSVEMSAEDPLFILYTSGSTGKPKGVVHTTGGYLVYASMTFHYVFYLSARRSVLVQCRCWLDYRALLCRLRPPAQ